MKLAVLTATLSAGLASMSVRADGANSGATNSPPSGNYPGTGSSITNVVPPNAPPTPGSGNGGPTNTPPSGVVPVTPVTPNQAP